MESNGSLHLLLVLLLQGLLVAGKAPFKQRDCLADCRLCAACSQERPQPPAYGCVAQCILCDMCHACLLNKVCQWEVRPVTPSPSPSSSPSTHSNSPTHLLAT